MRETLEGLQEQLKLETEKLRVMRERLLCADMARVRYVHAGRLRARLAELLAHADGRYIMGGYWEETDAAECEMFISNLLAYSQFSCLLDIPRIRKRDFFMITKIIPDIDITIFTSPFSTYTHEYKA